MALSGILSALRQLVLDGIDLPTTPEARFADYIKRFPDLSREECEDLSKMPPERLAIYTSSVFVAEAGIIKTYFSLTTALLSRAWSKIHNKELDFESFMQELHRFAPWRSIDSESLGRNLLSFIDSQKDLCKSEPWLLDIAQFEQLSMEVRKGIETRYTAKDCVPADVFSSLTVDQLVSLPLHIPGCVRVCELKYDVKASREEYLKNGKEIVPKSIKKVKSILVGGRPRDFGSVWVQIGLEQSKIILEMRNIGEGSVGSIAEAFLTDNKIDNPDEKAFIDFLSVLTKLMNAGVVVIPSVPNHEGLHIS